MVKFFGGGIENNVFFGHFLIGDGNRIWFAKRPGLESGKLGDGSGVGGVNSGAVDGFSGIDDEAATMKGGDCRDNCRLSG